MSDANVRSSHAAAFTSWSYNSASIRTESTRSATVVGGPVAVVGVGQLHQDAGQLASLHQRQPHPAAVADADEDLLLGRRPRHEEIAGRLHRLAG
jgi:hypothetical protein